MKFLLCSRHVKVAVDLVRKEFERSSGFRGPALARLELIKRLKDEKNAKFITQFGLRELTTNTIHSHSPSIIVEYGCLLRVFSGRRPLSADEFVRARVPHEALLLCGHLSVSLVSFPVSLYYSTHLSFSRLS